MNYQRIYDQLIKKRQDEILKKPTYFETHHIKPRCLGGSNDKSNLVRLTAREHFIAHYLLAKIYGGRLWTPVYFMSKSGTNSAKGYASEGRLYEAARLRHIEWMRKDFSGEGNPFFGMRHTPETLAKIKKNRPITKGEENPLFGYDFGEHFGWVISMVRNYKPFDTAIDRSLISTIHKAVGFNCFFDKTKKLYFRKQTEELKLLGQYYRGLNLGIKRSQSDITGKNNPNYGNDKVKGDANGRYRPEVYLWKHKYEKDKWLECTCYEAYTEHGMSKSGVIECVNLSRSGTRKWIFMGYADKSKEPKEVSEFIKQREEQRKPVKCPHCGKLGRPTSNGMVRYHFDRCKKRPA